MFDYMSFGGREIVNSARALGYSQTSGCNPGWLQPIKCAEGIREALEDTPYTVDNIDQAPWYDQFSAQRAAAFFGAYLVAISPVYDSTRQAALTEGILDGGVIGQIRNGMKAIRVQVALTAANEIGLEDGRAWLNGSMSKGGCSAHNEACGTSDVTFFAACPEPRAGGESIEDYRARIDGLVRVLHGVECTSGPTTVQQWSRDEGVGAIVEFTLTLEEPFVYSTTRHIPAALAGVFLFSDLAYNYVPHPSAELDDGNSVLVAQNLSTNPSVESDATGWAASETLDSGDDLDLLATTDRSTAIAAQGTYSYRINLAGDDSVYGEGVYDLNIRHTVALSGLATGTRVSASIWGAAFVDNGDVELLEMFAELEWVGGTPPPREHVGDATAFNGAVMEKRGILVPTGATSVIIHLRTKARMTQTPGDVPAVTAYADAAMISVP